MQSRAIVGALFLASVGFAACSSFSSATDAAPDADASTSKDDAATPDADVADALEDGGAVRASVCNAIHAFCDDFDSRQAGSMPDWGQAATVGTGATMNVRSFDEALSAPNVVESNTSGANAFLSTTIAVPDTKQGMTCRFAYQIISKDKSGNLATLAYMTLRSPGGGGYDVDFRYDTLFIYGKLPDGGNLPVKVGNVPPASSGVWNSVVIAMKEGAGGGIDVSVNGAAAGTLVPDPGITHPSTAHLDVGVKALSQNKWQVIYDDVVCDAL